MILLLIETDSLGAGRHRKMLYATDNARRCIKVMHNRDHGGDTKEIRRESELLSHAHLSRYLTDWSAIPVITAR